ncbi:FecR family protein [Acanthopleuribacter pedis]|uniref:FecR domain-containing protein n=1 Tax=Acanthopleuribacter pedis TaxID=442870 RepID=A0A8J7QLI0_9BACT|nr:FecR domain-containing protein [Acanthopleuribacter pedis]MBO1323351.1 FecR domain-containing protein [Acanthopleuribacter pedis]
MKPEKIPDETWFAAVLADECDPTDVAAFKAWLAEDPERVMSFGAYEQLWQRLAPPQAPPFDVVDGWCRLAAQLHLGSDVPEAWTLYLEDGLSAEERARIDQWRAQHKNNEAAFAAFSALWQATGPKSGPAFDVQQGWDTLAAELALPAGKQTAAPTQSEPRVEEDNVVPFPGFRMLISGAAGMAAVVLVGILIFFAAPPPSESKTVKAGPDKQILITLTDGTEVQLNAGSRLVFHDPLPRDDRAVTLFGQAYFKVEHDADSPFRIHTEEATVTVLGTRFEVWTRDRRTRVVVRDGSVALEDRSGKGRVVLTENQMSVVTAGKAPLEPREANAEAAISWRQGRIVFERVALADAVRDLGLAFDSAIVLDDPALGERTLSGSFPTDNLETVLEEIGLALNLAYTERDGVYHIHAR